MALSTTTRVMVKESMCTQSSPVKLLTHCKCLCRIANRTFAHFRRRMATSSVQPITTVEEANRFMVDCFKAVGSSKDNAETVAANLVEADNRGHYSHGMNRLEMYIRDVQGGQTDPNVVPTIEKETVSTAVVDGKNGYGAVVGKFCMDVAIKKAKETGIGMVVAHGSNHYGIAGMYTLQAIKEECIGMTFTNTSPFMVPTRGTEAALGTNPLSLGAPGLEGDSFVLDMATTAVAVGKIELAKRKQKPIPKGWALNMEGLIETDAEKAFSARKLMPLGGSEENSGYKGYGLGMLVEILSGLLSGASYGPNVRKWGAHGQLANLGHGFIAINPKVFAPGFESRMGDLMCTIRNMKPDQRACALTKNVTKVLNPSIGEAKITHVDPEKPILIHGDPERNHMEKVKKDGGLSYVKNQHDTNAKLAEELKVTPMVSVCHCKD